MGKENVCESEGLIIEFSKSTKPSVPLLQGKTAGVPTSLLSWDSENYCLFRLNTEFRTNRERATSQQIRRENPFHLTGVNYTKKKKEKKSPVKSIRYLFQL